ncbi:hypothetical protein DITRI_Ditri19aG0058200 [Diplodiscus trichospermus]
MLTSLTEVDVGKFAMILWAKRGLNTKEQDSKSKGGCERWHRPPCPYLKYSVDATFFKQENRTSIGMALREEEEEGFKHVIFEKDAMYVVDAIRSYAMNFSKFDSLIQSCKSFLQLEADFFVRFARRRANEIAYALAKSSHSHAIFTMRYEPPNYIVMLLSIFCTGSEH